MAYTLLTGSTGFIGRYLLRDFAKAGTKVVALVRGANASGRVKTALATVNESSPAPSTESSFFEPCVIQGDIQETELGLSELDRRWIARQVTSVVHCAADVAFSDTAGNERTWKTNVEGTRRLADFCERLGIADFSYISTAFVCGNRTGVILEDELDEGQGFGSDYEESKFHAERLLRERAFRRLSIFRPCFVAGDSRSGYSSTFHGIYWYALFTALARLRAGALPGQRWHHDVRIFRSPSLEHYMVPVDCVSRAVVEVHNDEAAPGGAHHLTPPQPFEISLVESALRRHYGYEGVRFSNPVDPSEWNETEKLFYDGLKSIGHRYLDGDPTFDCEKTLARIPWWRDVAIDEDYLVRLFRYADSVRFGRGNAKQKHHLTTC